MPGAAAPRASPFHGPPEAASMRKLLGFVGATIGGSLGWWLGSPVGLMTSFLISMLGTGVGMYVGFRIAQNYE